MGFHIVQQTSHLLVLHQENEHWYAVVKPRLYFVVHGLLYLTNI